MLEFVILLSIHRIEFSGEIAKLPLNHFDKPYPLVSIYKDTQRSDRREGLGGGRWLQSC